MSECLLLCFRRAFGCAPSLGLCAVSLLGFRVFLRFQFSSVAVIICSWFGVFPFPFLEFAVVVSFRVVVPFSAVAGSALAAGAFGVSGGASCRAFSGFACRASFPSAALAAEFAASWAGVVGVFCVVRSFPVALLFGAGRRFVVSVPCGSCGGAL